MRVLAVCAHPDDLEIFMFGTLAAYAEQGAEIVTAIATDGAKGGTGDPRLLSVTRKEEAREAAALLGIEPRFLDFPDGGLVAEALFRTFKELVDEVCPDVIFTHPPNDYHSDHRALSVAMLAAASFTAPVVSAEPMGGVGFSPTYYVDISAHFELKRRAIRCHRSQDPERFVDLVTLGNRYRSVQCNAGTGFAEVFHYDPIYPFADIRALLPPPPKLRYVRNRNLQPGASDSGTG